MTLKAIATNLYLRTMIKPRLDMPELDVTVVREMGERMLSETEPHRSLPADIHHQSVPADAARGLCAAEWLSAGAALDDELSAAGPIVLYTHGGAYCFGSLASHRPACAYLARQLAREYASGAARVLSLDYRLAPEHPFPAALDDALAWYRHVLDSGAPAQRIVLAGDSAGGGLALACALAAQRSGLPAPAAIVAFSPWVDLCCAGKSMRSLAHTEVMLPAHLPAQAADIYLNGHSAIDPLASPLYASDDQLVALPPLQVFASHTEILLDDATRLHDRAQAAGGRSEMHLATYLPHAWPVMLALPEARDTLKQAARFMAAQLDAPPDAAATSRASRVATTA